MPGYLTSVKQVTLFQTIFNESQMTGTFSFISLDTIGSGTCGFNNNIPNGSALDSVIADVEMPVDNTVW